MIGKSLKYKPLGFPWGNRIDSGARVAYRGANNLMNQGIWAAWCGLLVYELAQPLPFA